MAASRGPGVTETVLLTHAAATWFMVGLIWFVQVVHYPLMARVGGDGYTDYQKSHMARTGWVVAPAMFAELLTALALLRWRPPQIPAAAAWLGAAGVAVIWASTAMLQVPQHQRLTTGFNTSAHRRLVLTNWIRTALWTARALLVAWMLWHIGGTQPLGGDQ